MAARKPNDGDYQDAIAEIRERERLAFATDRNSVVGLLLAQARLCLERLRRGIAGRPAK